MKLGMMVVCLVVGAMACSAQAFVSLSVNAFPLNNQFDLEPANPSKTMAVVDRDGNGLSEFDFFNKRIDTWQQLFGDDWIVENAFVAQTPAGQWNESAGDDAGEFGFNNFLVTGNYGFDLVANGLEEGDEVFLFWFAEMPSHAPAGQYQMGILSLGTLPGDSGTLSFSNQTISNSAATLPFYWQVDVPEPASLALLGMGGLMMLNTRRNNR